MDWDEYFREQAARVSAAGMLLDRAFGKAPSFSTTDVNDFRRATELSDEELLKIASSGGFQLDPVGRTVGTPGAPEPKPSNIN
jgi:hypothetical protein